MSVTGALFFGFPLMFIDFSDALTTKNVVAYVAWWDQARGVNGVKADADLFSSVSPNWYTLTSTGAVVPYTNGQGQSYVDQSFVGYLRTNNVKIIPMIQNANSSGWDGQLVRTVISDPTRRATHITNIVNLVVANNYDGIDIDYESLLATDRTNFTLFIQQLATALHAHDKILAISVHPKTSEPGTWDGPKAQDWAALGAVVDEMRIMIYGYSWQSSAPGSISPIAWVNQVLSFAKTVIPAEKIIQGIPTYGIDWPASGAGTEQMWDVLIGRLATYTATLRWDTTSKTPWFTYTTGGNTHTVWFENASSTEAKLDATLTQGVAGISVWRLGGEDPKMWPVVRAKFGSNGTTTPPTGDTTPPTVTITNPQHGATIGRRTTISATASDNVGVQQVQFFVDNNLLLTDTTAPYSATWNSMKASAGDHVIKAVAQDAAGNSTTVQITVRK